MENILFKISFPAEFHAQTAVEAALNLHPQVAGRLADVERIIIETQESGKRIIDKTGPLDNPADRDHCIQYMVAVPLILGRLTASDYEDEVALDPRIDALREKMEVSENKQFTIDYLDPAKRSIGNSLQVFFKDGTQHRASRGGLSDRASPPPQRRDPVAARKIRTQFARSHSSTSGKCHPGTLPRRETSGENSGPSVHGPVRCLNEKDTSRQIGVDQMNGSGLDLPCALCCVRLSGG